MLLATYPYSHIELVSGWEDVYPYYGNHFKEYYQGLAVYTTLSGLGTYVVAEKHKTYSVGSAINLYDLDDHWFERSEKSRYAQVKKAIDDLQGKSIEKTDSGIFRHLIYLAPVTVEFSDVDEDQSARVSGTTQFDSIDLGTISFLPGRGAWVWHYSDETSDYLARSGNPAYYEVLSESLKASQEKIREECATN